MYTPVKLTLRNLLSHTNTEYTFKEGQAIMILGENRDDDGQENNGSGKSTLIEGILISCTGSNFRGVKDSDMIHYGQNEATVEFELWNAILGEGLKIERTLYASKNKSSTLECSLKVGRDGEWVSQKKVNPTVREGNKWILDKLGIGREDLINYFIVSKSKSVSFFNNSDSDKKRIVSRFSGTDPLLPIKEEIMGEIKALEGKKGEMERELLRLQGRGEAFQEQLELASSDDQEKLKKSRIESREEDIENYKQKIALLNEDKKSIERSEIKMNGELALLNNKQADFKIVDYSNELLKLKKQESDISTLILKESGCIDELQPSIDETKSFKSEIEQNLKDSIECPKCSHKFILRDETYDLENAKLMLPELTELIEDLELQVQSHVTMIEQYRLQQSSLTAQTEQYRKKSRTQDDELAEITKSIRVKKNEIDNLKMERDTIDRKIESYSNSIVELKKEIENIKTEELVDTSLEISKKIKENNLLIEDETQKLDKHKEEYVKLKEFEVIFTKFITHLSNKAVKSIELRTNNYLAKMGSNLSIEIEGYKVNSDGSIREKFTTIVSRDGIPEAFFESYSEGEQSRINIACTLALNSLLNLSCSNGQGLSLIVLDELMGSLDRLGVGEVMKALDSLNQNILAISHVEPKQNYPHTLVVIKEGGYSRIE